MYSHAKRGNDNALHWESEDKLWNVAGYAANLLKRIVENLMGVTLMERF